MNFSTQCARRVFGTMFAISSLVACLTQTVAVAQNTSGATVVSLPGSVVIGQVTERNRALPRAEVYFYDRGSHMAGSTVAEPSGAFVMRGLNPGPYRIEAVVGGRLVPLGRVVVPSEKSSIRVGALAVPNSPQRFASTLATPMGMPPATPAPVPSSGSAAGSAGSVAGSAGLWDSVFYVTDRVNLGNSSFGGLPQPECIVAPTCLLQFGVIGAGGARQTRPLSSADFDHELAGSAQIGGTPGVLLYVHGCCTTFDTAVDEALLIHRDIAPDGMPVVVFTMPTKANYKAFGLFDVPINYFYDENVETWSVPHLASVLDELVTSVGRSGQVHVMAHSLGNRLLYSAYQLFRGRHRQDDTRLGEIILMAPDLDTGTFVEGVPDFTAGAAGVTVYRSSQDKGMNVSRRLHQLPRLGGFDGTLFSGLAGADSVEASEFSCDEGTWSVKTGHFYWKLSSWVRNDISAVIRGNSAASHVRSQWLEPSRRLPGTNSWQFKDSLAPTSVKDCSVVRVNL